jgi:diphthamide biosynthesis protein 7
MRSPLAETQLGGGIWRIKWDPFTADYILTATMYNGFHLVDASEFTGMHLNIFFKSI